MEDSGDDVRGMVADGLKKGMGRGSIVRVLRGRGLSKEDAERLHDRVRLDVLREDLPRKLRKSGRRHLLIGLVALAAALAVAALAVRIVLHVLSGDPKIPMVADLHAAQIAGFAILGLILSVAEILWARSRFRLARKTEEKGCPRA